MGFVIGLCCMVMVPWLAFNFWSDDHCVHRHSVTIQITCLLKTGHSHIIEASYDFICMYIIRKHTTIYIYIHIVSLHGLPTFGWLCLCGWMIACRDIARRARMTSGGNWTRGTAGSRFLGFPKSLRHTQVLSGLYFGLRSCYRMLKRKRTWIGFGNTC